MSIFKQTYSKNRAEGIPTNYKPLNENPANENNQMTNRQINKVLKICFVIALQPVKWHFFYI